MPEVHLTGTIRSGSDFGVPAAYVRWRVDAGPGWTLLDGSAAGHSHTAEADTTDDTVAWEHPLDVHFSTSSLVGWPQLFVSVWSQDAFGRNEIAGYGCVRLPTAPGVHALEVVTWRPEGSLVQEWAAWFRGGIPQLTDTALVTAPGDARSLLGTTTSGSVMLEVQAVHRGFESVGVATA